MEIKNKYTVVENLTVSIEEKFILQEIDFIMMKGETTCLIGESGSGKSTLASVFVGQTVTQQRVTGKVRVGERDLLNISSKEWQTIRGRQIAYVAQNPMANFNHMQTIESHAREIYNSHLTKRSDFEKQFLASLEEVNLRDGASLLKKYPFQLSGGMLQRIMLAIFLMLKSEMFIFDEPTSALDSYNKKLVISYLRRLKTQGKTMLIITHDYTLLERLADRIIVLKNGNIIETGKASKLLSQQQHEYTRELLTPRRYCRQEGLPYV